MIGNDFIYELFKSGLDDDTCFNVLLDELRSDGVSKLKDYEKPKEMSNEEKEFEVKCVSLIEYYCNRSKLETPGWVKNNKYELPKPWFSTTKLSDVDYVRMVFGCPIEFQRHNVFFDLRGISRL